jgi:hypothetical protein
MTRQRTRNFLSAGLLAAAACTLGACNKPLLSEIDERTPFDRYDTVRNQFSQQYITDEYGRRQPNLRGRLMPKQ